MGNQRGDKRDPRGIIAVVAAFFVFVTVISYVWFPVLPWVEQRGAGERTVEHQVDAEQALQDYRWFRQQYHDIEAQRAQVENAYDEEAQFHERHGDDPNEWSQQAEERHRRIHERIDGNRNMLEGTVADYNARSDDAAKVIFNCHIPHQVDDQFAIAGPPGSGASEGPTDEYVERVDPNGEPPRPEQCDALPEQTTAETIPGDGFVSRLQ